MQFPDRLDQSGQILAGFALNQVVRDLLPVQGGGLTVNLNACDAVPAAGGAWQQRGRLILSIAIFGCCCSGDILRLSPEGFNLSIFYASTSIVSQMANPVTVDETRFVFRNRFERRCVLPDFGKYFLADLARQPVDYLPVDLMQEGTRQARVNGSLVKWTAALRESNLEKTTGYRFGAI